MGGPGIERLLPNNLLEEALKNFINVLFVT